MSSQQIRTLLEQIVREIGDSVYISAEDKDIESFFEWTRKVLPELRSNLSGYIEFSKIADGLSFNGLYIYSIVPRSENNIYDSNEEWWDNERQKRYLFFADDSISWYCLEISSGVFYVLDKPSGERMEHFQSFDELICRALEAVLCDEDDDED